MIRWRDGDKYGALCFCISIGSFPFQYCNACQQFLNHDEFSFQWNYQFHTQVSRIGACNTFLFYKAIYLFWVFFLSKGTKTINSKRLCAVGKEGSDEAIT